MLKSAYKLVTTRAIGRFLYSLNPSVQAIDNLSFAFLFFIIIL